MLDRKIMVTLNKKMRPGVQETEVGYQSQRKMNAGSMVARGNFARHNELANSDPGCPVQNQDLASSEIHTSPLMMQCSCKCGCERMEAKLKTCSNATELFDLQNVLFIIDAKSRVFFPYLWPMAK